MKNVKHQQKQSNVFNNVRKTKKITEKQTEVISTWKCLLGQLSFSKQRAFDPCSE